MQPLSRFPVYCASKSHFHLTHMNLLKRHHFTESRCLVLPCMLYILFILHLKEFAFFFSPFPVPCLNSHMCSHLFPYPISQLCPRSLPPKASPSQKISRFHLFLPLILGAVSEGLPGAIFLTGQAAFTVRSVQHQGNNVVAGVEGQAEREAGPANGWRAGKAREALHSAGTEVELQ